MSAKARLASEIASFATDPFGHAVFAYPWGEGPLQGISGPRRWQGEVLREIGNHLADPATRFRPKRIAISSGHGPGKTAAIAMVTKWALDTCPDTRCVLTANTESQLLTKVSPELSKWSNLSLTKDWFQPRATGLIAAQRDRAASWRADLIPWNVHSPESFAGLHNQGRRILVVFDEAAGIADKIWEVTEGALTDQDTEILWLAFGNPTRNTGRFADCFGRYRDKWSTRHIDSRTVEGTNKVYLDELVKTYGEDSDIAKVRVRGLFPSASSLQFIGSELVQAARERRPQDTAILPSDPVIFGVDHARFGGDASVLAIRQGRDAVSRPWKVWNGANSMEIAGDLATEASRFKPDAIFIDGGGPNAGGVIDRLRQLMGFDAPIYEINFGGKGREATWNGEIRVRTANKRAEMYTNMRAWLERGMIPDNERLAGDLTAVEYSYTTDNALLLERKEHMRARGLPSTDWSDALALTFAEHVEPRTLPEYLNPAHYRREEPFDRYAELDDPYARYNGPFSPARDDYDRYGEL